MPNAATFDVFATIIGSTYPEDTVTVYTDQKSAYEAHKLELAIADETDDERVNELDAQRKELIKAVKDSALVVRMRGVPSPVQEAIETKHKDEEDKDAFTFDLVAAHILDITNAQGEVDSRAWDGELVKALLNGIPGENASRILNKVTELTLKARYFEEVEVSEDFS